MLERLCKFVAFICEKLGRTLVITGTGGPTDVYLLRYYVIRSKYFNVFIHIFFRSDRDDMHDHPWDFATYIVRGGYQEEIPGEDGFQHNFRTNIRTTEYNRFATRKAAQLHRVKLPTEFLLAQKDKAPMTICVTGRQKREWGFMRVNGPYHEEWVNWKKYLGVPEDAPDRG